MKRLFHAPTIDADVARIVTVIKKLGLPAPVLGEPQAAALRKIADALEFTCAQDLKRCACDQ